MDEDVSDLTLRQAARLDPDDMIFFRMSRIAKSVEARLQAEIVQYDLTPGLYLLLSQIVRRPGMTQRELAERMELTPANVSILVSKLCGSGLVTRTPHGKANELTVTALGQQRYEAIAPIHRRIMAEIAGKITEDERQTLRQLLRKLGRP